MERIEWIDLETVEIDADQAAVSISICVALSSVSVLVDETVITLLCWLFPHPRHINAKPEKRYWCFLISRSLAHTEEVLATSSLRDCCNAMLS